MSQGRFRSGRPALLIALVVGIAGVVAFGGCGGGGSEAVSADELEKVVVLQRDRVDHVLEQVTLAQSKDEFLERMDDAAGTISDAAGDLDGVDPPERYRADVDRLGSSLEQLAFDVQATADQIREPEFGDLLTGTRGLSFESWNSVNRALGRLARAGIAVEPLERH